MWSSRSRHKQHDSAAYLRIKLKKGGAVCSPPRVSVQHPNKIRTTRFTWVTWLPKSLYLQFHRAANLYFATIALVSTVPFVGAKWQPKVLTLVSILLAQALKDMYEDCKRRHDDQAENSRVLRKYDCTDQTFYEAEWCDVDVGDLVVIEKGHIFPADTLVLASSDTSGMFYVATKSIDGETNLKERSLPHCVLELLPNEDAAESDNEGRQDMLAALLLNSGIEVSLEQPHPSIGELEAAVTVKRGVPKGVHRSNFGLRGCELQNTHWVIGVACYVGADTKARLNSFPPPSKSSELERFLNECVLIIIASLLVVSLYFAVASKFVGRLELSLWKVFLKYLVILYPVLPMTLYIAFEVVHLIIGFQIEVDPLMQDPVTGKHAKARNTSIVEELGQVDFVFSDKTGTLTANEMRFAYCCVGELTLGPFLPTPTDEPGPGFERAREVISDNNQEAVDFFKALAVCHTVKMDEDGTYQGESPDEVALVQAAASVGFALTARETYGGSTVHRIRTPWADEDHEITHVLSFTSDRKRMSVVYPAEDGGAIVTTKGADSVMEKLLAEPLPKEAARAIADFSRQGLRTLLVARRRVSPADFAAWRATWDEASSSLEGRTAKLDAASDALEVQMSFVGVTALEDRLQAHVPATIASMREAGIRVWVLTGDKVETAVEIAKSCKLVDGDMRLVNLVNTSSSKQCSRIMQEAIQRIDDDPSGGAVPSCGIVLDGTSVGWILEDEAACSELYELGKRCSSCVCCRLSPLQKRSLVELVRQQSPRSITLAIGDGANDVPMIQGAHVGVGIKGKEGSAAVQASDVAVTQFSFLGNVLLCHGRKSYRRVAIFLCFFVYKSVALGWSYIVYAHTMLFSGEGAYPQWLDIIWNPMTSCAAVLVLTSDVDFPDEVALLTPELYKPGPARRYFNPRRFARWMLAATFHGILAWSVPVYGLTNQAERVERPLAEGGPFWQASFTAFTTLFLIVHLKLFVIVEKPLQLIGLVALILELGLYFPVSIGLGSDLAPSHELLDAPQTVFRSWRHWCIIVFLPAVAVIPDLLEAGCCKWWRRRRRQAFGPRSRAPTAMRLVRTGSDTDDSGCTGSSDGDASDEEPN